MKDIHLTQENVYNGNLQFHYNKQWDFSYLEEAILMILEQNPFCDLFLYGGVEGCWDISVNNSKSQASNIVAI